jgi:hypothetical protein
MDGCVAVSVVVVALVCHSNGPWLESPQLYCRKCSARHQARSHRVSCDLTRAIASLHWLRGPQRVQFKVAVLTYKTLLDTGQQYLGPLVRVADLPGRQSLRSFGTNRLVVPPVRLAIVGSRACAASVPRVWNSLQTHVTAAAWLATFRGLLKTHLFEQSYPCV